MHEIMVNSNISGKSKPTLNQVARSLGQAALKPIEIVP